MPGRSRSDLVETLRRVAQNLQNVYTLAHTSADLTQYYSIWAAESARQLRGQLTGDELSALLFTPRYWAIHTTGWGDVTRRLVDTELDDRRDVLQEAIRVLEKETRQWRSTPGRLVVADTSFYCQHPDKLESADTAALARTGPIGAP